MKWNFNCEGLIGAIIENSYGCIRCLPDDFQINRHREEPWVRCSRRLVDRHVYDALPSRILRVPCIGIVGKILGGCTSVFKRRMISVRMHGLKKYVISQHVSKHV